MGYIRKVWHTRGYPWGIWGLTCAMLVAMGCGTLMKVPSDTGDYHQRVAQAAAQLASHFGDWVSEDTPVPPSATTLLHPNVIVSRKYVNLVTGQQVSFLLVQCHDARDLQGHYPPICYPSAGYTQTSANTCDWQVQDLLIHGMRYEFNSVSVNQGAAMVVCNFMVLPDGTTCRDMVGVTLAARNPRRRLFGAAQVQIIMDPGVPPAERDALVSTFVIAHRSLISLMLAGGKP